MKILGVDTSSDICSVCLLEDNITLKELNLNNGRTHSENLVPLLKELMDSCNVTFKDIELIAVNKGPGSFTGIRIGISTIKAIAEVHNIKVVGVTSLKSLCFNELHLIKDKIKKTPITENAYSSLPENKPCNPTYRDFPCIISLIDARNNQVYCGVFNSNSNSENEDIYLADDINIVLENIKRYIDQNTVFIGNGSVLHKSLIQENFNFPLNFSNINEQSSVSTALAGFEIYKTGNLDTADTILPFYLRKSQAERMKEINNNGNNK